MRHLSNHVPLIALLLMCLTGVTHGAPPTVDRADSRLSVDLGNGAVLHFAVEGDLLLGLRQPVVDGVALSSEGTVIRPVIAQEWPEDRMIYPFMRLKDAKVVNGKVHIEAELLGTTAEAAYRDFFVFAGNKRKALLPENITPEIKRLAEQKAGADAAMQQLIEAHEDYQKKLDGIAEAEAALETAEKPAQRKRAENRLSKFQRQRNNVANRLRGEIRQREDFAAKWGELLDAYDAAVEAEALKHGDIHRDYYRLPINNLPAESSNIASLSQQYQQLKGELRPAGTLTWVIEPVTENIAGWPYAGWKQHFEFQLADGRKVNNLWQVGTFEINGEAAGNTLVALRYRGLGRIEQPLTAGDEGVAEAFSTSDVMPGAVGGAPLVSPVVPSSEQINDRGYAAKHRVGAWIFQMARGAGHPLVDFQFSDRAVLIGFPERQGNVRALTEVLPGDQVVSQSDLQYFPLTDSHATLPFVYVAKVHEQPVAAHEMRTRWKEVDQYVRDRASEELGFQQYDVRPGVGLLYDVNWANHIGAFATGYLDGLADEGVGFVAIHNPGWINGRYQGPGGPPKTGGGVCDIYDYWPTADMEQPWREMQKAMARRNVAYLPWIGQTTWRDAPMVQRIGSNAEYWSLNAPHDDHGPGYGAERAKGNILNDHFREQYLTQLRKVREQFGYQGFWVDSFQNLFMSQLDWAQGTGNSMQRGWWEAIAGLTQENLVWMAESHSMPGLSCSIEVQGWEDDLVYFQHVWKWLRGNEQNHYDMDQRKQLVFHAMAAKGWVAPDLSYNRPLDKAMDFFGELAHQQNAALPTMGRPFVLAEERGMLWLPYDQTGEGLLFAFKSADLPQGVKAHPILDESKSVDKAEEHTVYRVSSGDDLRKAFGVAVAPLDDPRTSKTYEAPVYYYPDWAKE